MVEFFTDEERINILDGLIKFTEKNTKHISELFDFDLKLNSDNFNVVPNINDLWVSYLTGLIEPRDFSKQMYSILGIEHRSLNPNLLNFDNLDRLKKSNITDKKEHSNDDKKQYKKKT